MINIGIITNDNPKTDPSINVFLGIVNRFKCRIISLTRKDFLNSRKISSINLLYPRITPPRKKKDFDKYLLFYKKLIKKLRVPYTIEPDLLEKQYNKFDQLEMVKKAGFLVPETYLIKSIKEQKKIKKIAFPIIIKEIHGYGGKWVYLAKQPKDLEKIIKKKKKYLIQQYIRLPIIKDWRVYLVGGKVVGGLIRENHKKGEFRANVHQGAKTKFFYPNKKLSHLAQSIVQSLGNEIVSIDFLKKGQNYYFIELNNSFSVRTDNEPKKIKIAEAILSYLAEKGEK